ncbi:hypothetical protein OROMI_011591 [Orobanche minor]
MEVRAQLDSEIARAFNSNGLPFHYARNLYYIRSYNKAAESGISGYLPPTYNAFLMSDLVRGVIMELRPQNVVQGITDNAPGCKAAVLDETWYYSDAWLSVAPDSIPPQQDIELSEERNKCLKRYFPASEARTAVNVEFARFYGQIDSFSTVDSIKDRGAMDPKM